MTNHTETATLPEGLARYVGRPLPRLGVSYVLAGHTINVAAAQGQHVRIIRRAVEMGGTSISIIRNGRIALTMGE